MAVDKNKRRMPWRRERETAKWQTRIANKNPSNVTRVCTTAAVATLFPPLLSLSHSHQSGKKKADGDIISRVSLLSRLKEKKREATQRGKKQSCNCHPNWPRELIRFSFTSTWIFSFLNVLAFSFGSKIRGPLKQKWHGVKSQKMKKGIEEQRER